MNPIFSSLSVCNFRSFAKELTLPTIDSSLVIMGTNGTGKTSLLWSVLILCSAYNARAQSQLELTSKELMELFNYSALQNCHLGETTVHKSTTIQTAKLGATILDEKFECTLTANGVIKITLPELPSPITTIRYAFMGIEAVWGCPEDEVVVSKIATSQRSNMRARFRLLPSEYQETIGRHLQELFPLLKIKQLIDKGPVKGIFVQQYPDIEVELMFTGAAFRKVFVMFVLLYALVVDSATSRCVYLIEEPEVLLYTTVLRKVVDLLKSITHAYGIQLILTTNSEYPLNNFDKNNIYVLMAPDHKQYAVRLGKKKWLAEAINEHLLDVPNLSNPSCQRESVLILCEGENDPHFLLKIGQLYGVSFHGIDLRPSGSLNSHVIIQEAMNALSGATVKYLRDSDFNTRRVPRTGEIFWSLPSIESYLFIYYCEMHKDEDKSPLAFLTDPQYKRKFFKKYTNSCFSQQPDGFDPDHMLVTWNEAQRAAEKSGPVLTDDIAAVVRVLHGHTWVRYIKPWNCNKTGTLIDYIVKLGTIQDYLPSLGDELRGILGQTRTTTDGSAKDEKGHADYSSTAFPSVSVQAFDAEGEADLVAEVHARVDEEQTAIQTNYTLDLSS